LIMWLNHRSPTKNGQSMLCDILLYTQLLNKNISSVLCLLKKKDAFINYFSLDCWNADEKDYYDW